MLTIYQSNNKAGKYQNNSKHIVTLELAFQLYANLIHVYSVTVVDTRICIKLYESKNAHNADKYRCNV